MKPRNIVSVISILTALLASASGFAEQQSYKVLKGDSLYGIGKKFDTTPEALKELNGLKNDSLQVGQVLKVAAKPPASSAKTDKPAVSQPSVKVAADTNNQEKQQIQQISQTRLETQSYTVRSRDTLYGIARSFNLTVNDLMVANKLKNSNTLKVGQILTIPGEHNAVAETTQAKKPTEATSELAAAVQRIAVKAADSKPAASIGALNTRDRLVEAGFNMLGVRYRFGGTSEKTGLDCSALVKNLFEKFNLTLPRSSREQYKQGEKVAKEDLQKGDLVFFSAGGKTPTHVGIYIGDNQFLHAASRAKKVIVSDLGKTWYDLRYLGARRIMELWWEEPKVSLDGASLEWTHRLLTAWEDTQIPLNDTPPEEFNAPAQKHEASNGKFVAALASD